MDKDRIIAQEFVSKFPLKAAQVLEGLNDDEVAAYLQVMPKELALSLLNYMNTGKAARCFPFLSTELAKDLIEKSDLSLSESLCRQFDDPYRTDLLSNLAPDISVALNRKLQQAADTIGLFMVPAMVVNKEMTVKDAIDIIRRNKVNLETYLYVVDLHGTFEGAVRLKDLLFVEGQSTIETVMITDIPKFFPDTPIKSVLDHPAWYEYRLIPVIDRSNKLLGILPYKKTKGVTTTKSDQRTKDILQTSEGLGELYRIGITGFLQSFGK